MSADPRVHVGTAAWVTNEGRLLMLWRRPIRRVGCWSVPGGWVDWGEHPEEAVLRELYEETGLVGHDPKLAAVVANSYPDLDQHVVCLFYSVHAIGEPRNREPDKHSDLGWVYLDDVPSRTPQFPPFRSFLESR